VPPSVAAVVYPVAPFKLGRRCRQASPTSQRAVTGRAVVAEPCRANSQFPRVPPVGGMGDSPPHPQGWNGEPPSLANEYGFEG
jgi:hypothetical protein